MDSGEDRKASGFRREIGDITRRPTRRARQVLGMNHRRIFRLVLVATSLRPREDRHTVPHGAGLFLAGEKTRSRDGFVYDEVYRFAKQMPAVPQGGQGKLPA